MNEFSYMFERSWDFFELQIAPGLSIWVIFAVSCLLSIVIGALVRSAK